MEKLKDYESAKKRGDAEKDLKEEVHNVLYDNSDMIDTKIKEVQKFQPDETKPIKRKNTQELLESDSELESETESIGSKPPLDEYERW